MNKKYRFGLDLGTSSIGTAVYEVDDNGNVLSLVHLDSYIFGEPVAPKEMVTLNTSRRSARLIRRQIERKAARLRKISYISKTLGITKEMLNQDKEDVISLRARATSEKISLTQLVKVLCHIVKNRGYRGNLSKDNGNVAKSIKCTEGYLVNGKTLGQVLLERKEKANGQPWRKIEETGTFIYRNFIEKEFDIIWNEQEKYYPELKGMYSVWGDNMFPDFPHKKEISLKDAFHSAIFYQRPIKWKLESVGNCTIFPSEKRACCSQMSYQHYRLASDIAKLRLPSKINKEGEPLPREQQEMLFNYIDSHSEEYNDDRVVPFSRIYEILEIEDKKFTIDRSRGIKQGLKGNTTLYELEKVGVLNEWAELSETEQELVMEFFANVTNLVDIEDNDNDYIKEKFNELTKNISSNELEIIKGFNFVILLKEKGCLAELEFDSGRSSYSSKGLVYLTKKIQEGIEENQVLQDIKKEKDINSKLRTVAKIREQESISDPVVTKALAEFYRIMKYLTHRYGNPDEIVIELSRDMKNSLKRRQFLESQNKIQLNDRKEAIKELKANGKTITPRNIERWLLWTEQAHVCPYSGQTIDFGQAFDEKKTEVDHIVPRQGEIGGPNTFENKVLVFSDENHNKSNNLPYTWKFKQDIDSYTKFIEEVKQTKKNKESNLLKYGSNSPLINFVQHLWTLYGKENKPTQKGVRILRKINNLLATPKDIEQDFVERQNHETAWITKIVSGWCKDICPKVTPSFGALTAYLRDELEFEKILPLVRIKEGKPLYDKEDKVIGSDLWEELFSGNKISIEKLNVLKDEFEKYLAEREEIYTEKDRKKAFKEFIEQERKQFKFNKRCDHRHHAVDAAVIGLSNLSLVQKAEKHHAKHGTLYTIHSSNPEGTHNYEEDIVGFDIRDIRNSCQSIVDEVASRLINYVVWHKPDHFPCGRLFDETAYNIVEKEGVKRFVKRGNLNIFIKKTPKETIENLEKLLFGEGIKSAIIEQFKARLDRGISQEEALCGKKDNPRDGIMYRGNKIKSVRYMYLVGRGLREFDPNSDKEITNGINKKTYQNAGYACMDFDKKTGKQIQLVPLWKYSSKVNEDITRIFINDILLNKKENKCYRVIQFSAQHGLVLREVTEVNPADKRTSNLKDYQLISSRQMIKIIKDGYTAHN